MDLEHRHLSVRITQSFDVENFGTEFAEYTAGLKPTRALLFRLLDLVRPAISRAIRNGASLKEITKGLQDRGILVSVRQVKIYVDLRVRKSPMAKQPSRAKSGRAKPKQTPPSAQVQSTVPGEKQVRIERM
ncbi:hypothetical protein [Ferrovibrio sp.]|uniref:hypothetical protein n=1 Tax=Ferrovibrio sp. TaxID=1917215 RepID=UPI0026319A72|nr:hypothetical protein [Ferrovibrio sp.]